MALKVTLFGHHFLFLPISTFLWDNYILLFPVSHVIIIIIIIIIMIIIAGEQKRVRRLILTLVVSGTFLKRRADLRQNVGTFLAFLCYSNWNEWYVSKWWSKGPVVEFKIRGRVM